jgi:phosphoglycolate phosphatase
MFFRMPICAVFFDLDGTLVDNFTAVHACCNLVERDLGLPLTDYTKVRSIVGGSIVLTMQRLVGLKLAPKAIDLYRGYFEQNWVDGLTAMPGAAWLLEELLRTNVRSAVLTNKNEVMSRKILNHMGLGVMIDEVVGTKEGDAAKGIRKPNPVFTQRALDRMKSIPAETLMVGDSPFDAETGINAGIPTHLVATGTHKASELAGLKVDGIHADLYELGRDVFGFTPPEKR